MAEADLDDLSGGKDPPAAQPDKPKRRSSGGSRGRPSRENVSTELKGSISGGLAELAEWLEPRDPELAKTLKDSAARIADFLAVHAAKRANVSRAVKYVFAKGGPFAALRAFGPITRAVSARLAERRAEREGEPEPTSDQFYADQPPGPAPLA